jgi:predicted nucleic acid-binding Zn ribbon protein
MTESKDHLIHMRKRKSKEEFVHIGSIIGDVLKQYGRESDAELTRVWQIWDDTVGAAIAANAQPAAFKGDLLLVHVNSSTWIHQLQFLKPDIISKVNTALGKPMIAEIKFKIGPFS